jgi:hypothetical protein
MVGPTAVSPPGVPGVTDSGVELTTTISVGGRSSPHAPKSNTNPNIPNIMTVFRIVFSR